MSDQQNHTESQAVLQGGNDHAPPPPPPPPRSHPQPPPRGEVPPRLDPFAGGDMGPDPMDFLEIPGDSRVIRITRERCNGEESDETGFAGMVARVIGFEEEVRRRWGGGDYVARAVKNGKTIERSFTIGGPSKPLNKNKKEGEEEEEEDDDDHLSTYYDRFRRRRYGTGGRSYSSGYRYLGSYADPLEYDGRSPYGRSSYGGYGGGGAPPYGTGSPYDGPSPGGFPGAPPPYGQRPPFGQNPYSIPPHQQPGGSSWPPQGWQTPPGFSPTSGQPPNVYVPKEQDEKYEQLQSQLESMREELAIAREEAAKEREERRLDLERAAAKEREAQLKREIDMIKAEQARRDDEFKRQVDHMNQQQQQQLQQLQSTLQDKGPTMADRLIEMQMTSLAQQQQRAEQERLEREQRAREEAIARREEARAKEAEWKRDQQTREEREERARELEEKRRLADRQLADQQRRDAAEAQQRMLEVMLGQKQKPEEMLSMLEKMVKLRPEKDTFEEIQKLAGVAVMVKDLLGGQEQAEDKWSSIIRTGSEALGKAIGDIQSRRQQGQQQPYQQYLPQQQNQPQGLPGPTAPQQAAPGQLVHDPSQVEPSGEEWGRVLGFAVDSFDTGNDAEATATHMHTMVMVGMQRPRAIEQLENGTVDQLRVKLNLLKLDPRVSASPMAHKIDRFLEILSDEGGAAWVQELLNNLTLIQQQIREAQEEMLLDQQAAQQAQAAAQQQQQQQQQSQPQGQPQPSAPSASSDNMSPEAFAAQARGNQAPTSDPSTPEPTAEDFSRNARGEDSARDPTGGWGS